MADIDYYPSGTGASLYDKSNLTRMYRGEGAYDFIDDIASFNDPFVSIDDPYRGTWYTTDLPYARAQSMFNKDEFPLMRRMDVKLPFKYEDTPTINELIEHQKFIRANSAIGEGSALGQDKIIHDILYNNEGTTGKPRYITKAQSKLGVGGGHPSPFTLNYPKEFVDASSRVDIPESIRSMLRSTYRMWTPYEGTMPKWQIPSWAMAKNMMQDVTKGSQGIMAAYLNDIKKKYTPNWAKSTWLNNPATRTGLNLLKNVGWAGDVLLQGAALKDVYTGSRHVGDAVTNLNRAMNVPMDRQGNVIQSNRVYKNLQKAAQRDVLNPNEMRGVTSFDTTRYNPREMNTGGIVSLVL